MTQIHPSVSRNIRILLIAIFGVVALVTVVVLLFVTANYGGKRAWTEYKESLEARGESLDLKRYIPPEIPDAQNFAATPFFTELFETNDGAAANESRWPQLYSNARNKPELGPDLIDLAGWVRALARDLEIQGPASRAEAARLVLQSLEVYDPVLNELQSVRQRPLARYPVGYDLNNPFMILLPHLQSLRGVCQVLQLKAVAELAAGNPGKAYEDVQLMLRVTDSLDNEPFLISFLVQIAVFQLTLPALQEGLVQHSWTESQLAELQKHLAQYDFRARLRTSLRMERAAGVGTIDSLREGRLGKNAMNGIIGPGSPRGVGLVPSGWLYREQLSYSRLFDEFYFNHQETTFVEPAEIDRFEAQMEASMSTGRYKVWAALFEHRILASLLMPAMFPTYAKSPQAQAPIAPH